MQWRRDKDASFCCASTVGCHVFVSYLLADVNDVSDSKVNYKLEETDREIDAQHTLTCMHTHTHARARTAACGPFWA